MTTPSKQIHKKCICVCMYVCVFERVCACEHGRMYVYGCVYLGVHANACIKGVALYSWETHYNFYTTY